MSRTKPQTLWAAGEGERGGGGGVLEGEEGDSLLCS